MAAVLPTFRCAEAERQGRLMIPLAHGKNRFYFADFSLKKASLAGLPKHENLEAGNVGLPLAPVDCLARTPQVARDVVDFLYEIDDRYFTTIYDFLKNDLGCKHPIKGTQANSDYSSLFTQAKCDFLDVHGYWKLPRIAADGKKWTFSNLPMVNARGSSLVSLASCRVKGKPFNVSEYGHPAQHLLLGRNTDRGMLRWVAGLGRDNAIHLCSAITVRQRHDHQLLRAQESSDQVGDDAVRRWLFAEATLRRPMRKCPSA